MSACCAGVVRWLSWAERLASVVLADALAVRLADLLADRAGEWLSAVLQRFEHERTLGSSVVAAVLPDVSELRPFGRERAEFLSEVCGRYVTATPPLGCRSPSRGSEAGRS